MPAPSIPVALSIAGSDNSAGAGLQADLKTFTALGVYGLTAATCVVAEVPGFVGAVHPVPPEIVAEQVRLSLAAFPVGAIKTGMLFSRAIIEAVCGELERRFSQNPPPLVVDPVMVASSGAALLEPDAVRAYTGRLFPLATVVTPNLDEAAVLLGRPIATLEEMREAGRELCLRHGCAFLLKGGHLRLPQEAAQQPGGEVFDLLCMPQKPGEVAITEYRAPRVPGVSTHGTGCTVSAALAAGLAAGLSLAESAAQAKIYITRAIAESYRWAVGPGRATEALNHQAMELREKTGR